ncbi:unnamed protein product [Effrenium voratum]|uniref:Pseudouridine synthase RsuA/RluA-like domain-containing protein n=1 Tax=Effrenium voratum TaxID=2562239 RepID=A0AA36IJG0_9DINO|nr:unnamed protein product [Effrenium voratum]
MTKVLAEDAALLAALAQNLSRNHSQHDAQHLANSARASAVPRLAELPALSCVGQAFVERGSSPQDLANVLRTFAKAAALHTALLNFTRQSARLAECTQQHLANLLRGFATLAAADMPLASMLRAFGRLLPECTPQSLANVSWGTASLQTTQAPLMAGVGALATARALEPKPQESTNSCRAFAALLAAPWPPLAAAAEAAAQKRAELRPQDVAGLARALAACVLVWRPPSTDVSQFGRQDIANGAWASATTRIREGPLMDSAARAACGLIRTLDAQDAANSLWGSRKLETSAPQLFEMAAVRFDELEEPAPQNLAMAAWASASAAFQRAAPLEAANVRAKAMVGDFAVRDLANLLWSSPALELQIDEDLFGRALQTLLHKLPAEIANVRTHVLRGRQEPLEAFEFLNSILQIGWAAAFSGRRVQRLEDLLRAGLADIGAALDATCRAWLTLGCTRQRSGSGLEQPRVLLDVADMAVVLKPAHWEVDARPPEEAFLGAAPGAARLSSFLQGAYSCAEYPLLFSEEHQFGLIHRLDVPSSGLILVGKTFRGYFALRWQQDTYDLGRHYLVLCHGQVQQQVVNARIKTTKTYPATSYVSAEGKTAWTWLRPLCVLCRGSADFTLLLVVIRTGRTHQIRVHARHIGHPTVMDEKYADPAVCAADAVWCPRNFLHRFQVTFEDLSGTVRRCSAPLPADLLQALRELTPAREAQEVWQSLLTGWLPSV